MSTLTRRVLRFEATSGDLAMPRADSRAGDQPLARGTAPDAGLRAVRRSSSSARPVTWRIASWSRRSFSLPEAGTCRPNARSIGFARRPWTDDDLRAEYEKTLAKEGGADFSRGLVAIRQPASSSRRARSMIRPPSEP